MMSKCELGSTRRSGASTHLDTDVPDAPPGPPDPRRPPPVPKAPPAPPTPTDEPEPKPVEDPPAESEPKPPYTMNQRQHGQLTLGHVVSSSK